jgi:hypothetical protein
MCAYFPAPKNTHYEILSNVKNITSISFGVVTRIKLLKTPIGYNSSSMKTLSTKVSKWCPQFMAVVSIGVVGLFIGLQTLAPSVGVVSVAVAQPIQSFPADKNVSNLKSFWIRIFTEFSDESTIVHDKTNPHIFYKVIKHKGVEHFARKRLVSRTEKAVIAQLSHIYRKLERKKKRGQISKKTDPKSIYTKSELELVKYVPKEMLLNPKQIRTLAKNVRNQQGMNNRVRDGIERSMMYLDYVRSEFANAGLPTDLAYLPHVESSFNYKAYSRVGAAGIWQFMPVTAKFYKLKVSKEVDERLDPIKSTKAAVKLLKDNYRMLDSWPLAITGYNHGVNSMRRAVKKFGTNDFSKIFLSYNHDTFEFASKNFYPSFLAAVEVAKNPAKYFSEFSNDAKSPLISPVVLEHPIRLSDMLRKFKISLENLRDYNPHIMKVAYKNNARIPKGINLYLPGAGSIDDGLNQHNIRRGGDGVSGINNGGGSNYLPKYENGEGLPPLKIDHQNPWFQEWEDAFPGMLSRKTKQENNVNKSKDLLASNSI